MKYFLAIFIFVSMAYSDLLSGDTIRYYYLATDSLSVSKDCIKIYKVLDGIMLIRDTSVNTYLEYRKTKHYVLYDKVLSDYLFDDIIGEMVLHNEVDEGSIYVTTKYGSYTLFLKETADSIATSFKWKKFSNAVNNDAFGTTIRETLVSTNRFNRIVFPYYMCHNDNPPRVNTISNQQKMYLYQMMNYTPAENIPEQQYVPQRNTPIHLKKMYTPAGYGIPGNSESVDIDYTIH